MCASEATYQSIKQELFRLASQERGLEEGVYAKIAEFSVVRITRPLFVESDATSGRISCSGTVSIALPSNLADNEGHKTVDGDLEYFVQPAADGSGNAVTLNNADAMVSTLAKLQRVDSSDSAVRSISPDEEVSQPPNNADEEKPTETNPSQTSADPPSPSPERSAALSGPSFNCQSARTESEIAVCSNASLALLDRQMSAFFNRSMGGADEVQAKLLRETRSRFLGYRERCGSDVSCIDRSYRGRITEIGDIVAGRWRGNR